MVRKIVQKFAFYRKIRFFLYIYLNYFCKNVVRTDDSRIIPYKYAIINLESKSRILLSGGDMEIGCERLKGSKVETLIRLRRGATWKCDGGCRLFYGTTVEVLCDGCLDSQFFAMNTGSVIITAKSIRIGRDIMIGRNALIYDSDYHSILDPSGKTVNMDAPVVIGNHVWLTTNVTVLKGACIGDNSLIGANSMVRGNVASDTLYKTVHAEKTREKYGTWSWKYPTQD